ncbi:MAG: TlyA family RNA methyltransferase [Alphaproteobacteria bacterium]|nr:TlyA family RNA methyltransferase [Alphaproteobacteria bacterium]
MPRPEDQLETRLDVELVRRGLSPSRTQARAAIEAGQVRIDGVVAVRPGQPVTAGSNLEAGVAHPWVSRGGTKLAHALDVFGVSPTGRDCLDVGASTGGFCDVLLSRGARRVVAVDVGRGQLHPGLAADGRVQSLEATDARTLTARMIGEPPSLVVCDASFIGLEKILPVPLGLAAPGADLVALFKPQFEVGRPFVGKGGIVTDEAATTAAAARFEGWLAEVGWIAVGWTSSPITGGDGNRERLVHARRVAPGLL